MPYLEFNLPGSEATATLLPAYRDIAHTRLSGRTSMRTNKMLGIIGARIYMARMLLGLAILLVFGCATKFPQESDISGSWEAVGSLLFPYILFEYESSGNSYLVLGGPDGSDENGFIFIRLTDFVSREEDFTLLATLEGEDGVDSSVITGQIYDSQMVLRFSEWKSEELSEVVSDAGGALWLVRPEVFDSSRAATRRALEAYKAKSR